MNRTFDREPVRNVGTLHSEWRQILNRQARGADFISRASDEKEVEALMRGQLTLRPHPTWDMPNSLAWNEDPFKQRNWRFQLHTLRWLEPLRRVAVSHGDRDLANVWWDFAESWITSNPPEKPATKWAWVDMADGLRSIVFSLGLEIVEGQRRDALVSALRVHLNWLLAPENYGHGNHAMHQNSGAWVLALLVGTETERDFVLSRITDHLRIAFDTDGVNEEGSLAYQLLNRRWWLEMKERLAVEDVELPEDFKRLENMPTFLAHATRPDGELEQLGDTDSASAKGVQAKPTLYATSEGKLGQPPIDLHATYPSGWIFGRDSWGTEEGTKFQDATYYSVRYGAQNAIHGHEDGGSLTFYSHGVPIIVDGGRYNYSSDPYRKYFVGRRSHNSVQVPGLTSNRSAEVRLVDQKHSENLSIYHLSDPSYPGVAIERTIVFAPRSKWVIVLDSVKSDSRITAEQAWRTPLEAKELIERSGIFLETPLGGYALKWAGREPSVRIASGEADPVEGWISTGWQTKKPCNAIFLGKTGKSFQFNSALLPVQGYSEAATSVFKELPHGRFLISGRSGYELVDINAATLTAAPRRIVSGLDLS